MLGWLLGLTPSFAEEPPQDRYSFAEMYVGADVRGLSAPLLDTASRRPFNYIQLVLYPQRWFK